uniref:Uncharacterized protein n=1 Tax=Oryza sativa subsp. japonica TaxID=39947 RepID=Q6K8S2_ORYSJ|nr:hypothetical protein [Oryza sativa Japonica Group]
MLHLKAIDLSIDHKPIIGSECENCKSRTGGRVLAKKKILSWAQKEESCEDGACRVFKD